MASETLTSTINDGWAAGFYYYDRTGTSVRLGFNDGNYAESWFIFSGTSWSAGETFSDAYLTLTSNSNQSDANHTVRIEGQLLATHDWPQFQLDWRTNHKEKNRTTNTVEWTFSGTQSAGATIVSPDISSILNEIKDLEGWDQTFLLFVRGITSSSDSDYFLVSSSDNATSAYHPALSYTYGSGGGGGGGGSLSPILRRQVRKTIITKF